MATGIVKWFNPSRGYGFIETNDKSPDVFVHISAVEQSGLSTLNEGQSIDFEIQDKDGKQSASKITEAA